MIRRALLENQPDVDSDGFRLRGREVTRLEGLADGVFALALTLLILSAEVPRTFGELQESIKGLPAFAVCFATIMWSWAEHYKLSRRYGFTDRTMVVLNSFLLFVILFYVYPLKFLFSLVVSSLIFGTSRTPAGMPLITNSQVPQLFLLYGVGFASVAFMFLLMHRHALKRSDDLELTPAEVVLTRGEVVKCAALVLIAALSIGEAYTLPLNLFPLAGISYALVGVSEWYFAARYGRMAKELQAQEQPAPR
jgi:uncharacterized membrane protein